MKILHRLCRSTNVRMNRAAPILNCSIAFLLVFDCAVVFGQLTLMRNQATHGQSDCCFQHLNGINVLSQSTLDMALGISEQIVRRVVSDPRAQQVLAAAQLTTVSLPAAHQRDHSCQWRLQRLLEMSIVRHQGQTEGIRTCPTSPALVSDSRQMAMFQDPVFQNIRSQYFARHSGDFPRDSASQLNARPLSLCQPRAVVIHRTNGTSQRAHQLFEQRLRCRTGNTMRAITNADYDRAHAAVQQEFNSRFGEQWQQNSATYREKFTSAFKERLGRSYGCRENANGLETGDAVVPQTACHFLVEADGTIHQKLPLDQMGLHIWGMNQDSICIENVGAESRGLRIRNPRQGDLTVAQVMANARLIRYLKAQFPIEFVFGHDEQAVFGNENAQHQIRSDHHSREEEPGRAFMTAVRDELFSPSLCRGGAPCTESALCGVSASIGGSQAQPVVSNLCGGRH